MGILIPDGPKPVWLTNCLVFNAIWKPESLAIRKPIKMLAILFSNGQDYSQKIWKPNYLNIRQRFVHFFNFSNIQMFGIQIPTVIYKLAFLAYKVWSKVIHENDSVLLFWSTESGVLQNMSNPGWILGHSFKVDWKSICLITRICKMNLKRKIMIGEKI